jgi:Tfp pilus assembly protein PilF/ribonuclease BN (tRNA processing enzyme)
MAKKSVKGIAEDENAEFGRLFWAARREHSQATKKGATDGQAHKAAVAFAETHGWAWAEQLLEISSLDKAGESDKALQALAKLEASIPVRWQGLFHLVHGAALDAKGEYDEAIKAYRKALDDPKFDTPGNAWNNLGIALGAKGEHDEAIKANRKALDDPKYDTPGNAWNNLGVVLYAKGEHDEAIKAYRKALEDPKFDYQAKVWTNLAQTYLEAGKQKLAEEAFEKALLTPDPQGGDHARARAGLTLLKSNIKPEALSPDDRAMVGRAASSAQTDEIENGVIAAIQAAGDTQYEKYIAKDNSERDDTLSILRGWSSAVTLLEGSERRWRGGGYFLKWRGHGIVIDPGFDFLRNFHDAGFHGREIHTVVVSHNHPDHNSDLKGLDDLCYELFKRRVGTENSTCRPYVLLWDQDTAVATKFSYQKPQHQHEPVVFPSGYPQPINLLKHPAKIPVRIAPFKVNHGSDVPHAMGMVLELLDLKSQPALRIGYTADTAYSEDLHQHLANCDILIAHISQPTIEELQDPSKLKEDHLGYRGTARLLKECKPKLALIGEFWAGFTDLRISLVKGLRQRSGLDAVLPAGLAMHLRLPSLEIECTECHKPTPFPAIKVAPPTDNFGSLAYLCSKCMIG